MTSSSEAPVAGQVALGKVIGFIPSVAFIVGIVIGTGIFVSPTGILRGVDGSVGWAFAIWISCAIIAMFGALSYMELASSFTKSGGEFIFIKESFGPALAFLRIWTLVAILGPASIAVQSLTVANYLITPFVEECNKADYYVPIRLIAACVMCLIIFVNCVSVPVSSHLQTFLTLAKIVGLAVLIVTGIVLLFQGNTDTSAILFMDYITCVTEEIKKPEKTVVAMVVSLTFVTIVYLLANVAYLTALSPDEILSSDAVAATFAVRVLKNWSWTIWIFVAMSATGNLNGLAFTRCRMFFVAAREGYLPEVMSMIHVRWKTPLPAMAFSLPLSLLLLFVSDVYVLIDFLTSVDTAFTVISVLIIPYFRWKQPDRPSTYRVPLFMPIVFIVFNVFILLMSFYSTPVRSTLGLVTTLMGLVFYYLGCRWKNKPESVQNAIDSTNQFLQKFFLSVRQEVKTY